MDKNNVIQVKSSWNDVTIKEFQSIESMKLEDFEDEFEYTLRQLEVLSDLKYDDIMKLDISVVNECFKVLSNYVSDKPSGKLKPSYVINGCKYNLLLQLDKMKTVQWTSLNSLLKHNKGSELIHNMLSVILIKDGCSFEDDDYDVELHANYLRDNFNIADTYTICSFFLTFLEALLKGIQCYSVKKIKKMIKKEKDMKMKESLQNLLIMALSTNGDGNIMSIEWLKKLKDQIGL